MDRSTADRVLRHGNTDMAASGPGVTTFLHAGASTTEAEERAADQLQKGLLFRPDPGLFSTLFPYHLVLDKDLRVVQVGTATRFFHTCTAGWG